MNTVNKIHSELTNDKFSHELRLNLNYNQPAFNQLILTLQQLSKLLLNETMIPKALAQELYAISSVTRNALDWLKLHQPDSQLTNNVESAWIDIDNLIIECLST